jgi:crotonobetainyl-CoA:carnitine CoA-transferase CaiB-like acyl-CoA transferase
LPGEICSWLILQIQKTLLKQIAPTLLFNNLKVIELAGVLAGPAAGMFFAELGATVIKIENKLTNGDITRSWKRAEENPTVNSSSYYHSVNWEKKTLMLNLNNVSERHVVYEHVKDADVIIANYKQNDAIKLGMDYAFLKTIQPKIIYAQLKGFEMSDRVAYDAIVQAETGFMSLNGTSESGPLKLPVAFMDIIAAHLLKEGILTALINRNQTGEGCYVETSLEKAGLTSLMNQSSVYLNTNKSPERMGSLHPNIAPYGETFYTSDGKLIILAVGSDDQFRKLCEILNSRQLLQDERYTTNIKRVTNRTSLEESLKELFIIRNSNEIAEMLDQASIPYGFIRDVSDVLDQADVKKYILEQKEDDGSISKRMMTAGFSIFK